MTTWLKNQATASLRRAALQILSSTDGTPAPRETDFTGYVYITQDGNDYVAAAGTLTNRRRALVVADDTFTAAADDVCTAAAHGLELGDGPFQLTTTDTLPAGLSLATDYWIIYVSDDTYKLATSLANAYAGTAVDITDAGTGTHTISDTASTQRGIDGWFNFQATQAETNYSTAEIYVAVLGHATYEAQTVVTIDANGDGDAILEGGWTRDDLRRVQLRTMAAKFSKVGNVFTFRDLADTKDSHTGTVTASGRILINIIDPT